MAQELPEISICERLQSRFISLGKTLSTAESCSGGLIAHRITNIAGSSAFFLGGVVAYHNTIKQRILGVEESVLAAVGAVSEPVARQMATGVREWFGADYAVAVTGIAGPGGGTPEKPVGLVYMAVATSETVVAARHVFSGSREEIKQQTAETALCMVLEVMK